MIPIVLGCVQKKKKRPKKLLNNNTKNVKIKIMNGIL